MIDEEFTVCSRFMFEKIANKINNESDEDKKTEIFSHGFTACTQLVAALISLAPIDADGRDKLSDSFTISVKALVKMAHAEKGKELLSLAEVLRDLVKELEQRKTK